MRHLFQAGSISCGSGSSTRCPSTRATSRVIEGPATTAMVADGSSLGDFFVKRANL